MPIVKPMTLELLCLICASLLAQTALAADNLVFVTWDGFRWQELFRGADPELLNNEFGGIPRDLDLKSTYWRDSAEARRELLLPFFWKVLARQGQVFGDPDRNSTAKVTNGRKFSYPGYNEMFVGFADDRIDSNNKIANPNVNVLEYLNRKPEFAGKVAAFATWDVIDFILNRDRSGLLVHTGWTPIADEALTVGQRQVNDMVRELPRLWRGNVYDVVSYRTALEHLLRHQPRIIYLGLGETDEWAHARRYDLYLEAATRSDRYLGELWEKLQSIPQYKDRTALIVTTDHGRGGTPRDWTNHNAETDGAENIWIAAMGADVPARGIRVRVAVTQSQVAATIASLVGVNFQQSSPDIAPPLPLNGP